MKDTRKQNNSGFSLLEVLVAVIILAIISIPLIRSFGTVAVTNSKAKKLMMATDCAENMMEIVEQLKIEEFLAEYDITGNTVTEDASTGKYTFEISNVPSKLPEGYTLEVTVDPSLYPNNNSLNVSDVKSMSVKDTAVYEMSALYDDGVYSKFHAWNDEAVLGGTEATYMKAPTDYFKKNLIRTIDLTIDKEGTELVDGEAVDLVTVTVDVKYEFRTPNVYWRYLPSDQSSYADDTQEIFNNLTTKVPLYGIYLLYQPRKIATQIGNADVINIHNPDNIEANLYVVAQPGDGDSAADMLYYNVTTGPLVTINETWTGGTSDDAALTLYTNLSKEAPYSESDVDGEILCRLSYVDEAGMGVTKTGADALKVLDGRDLDGKMLLTDNIKDRIYKVVTTVKNTKGETVIELDGTKLE